MPPQSTAVCRQCGVLGGPRHKRGLCKRCYDRECYAISPDKKRAAIARYLAGHREQVRAYQARYYREHEAELKASGTAYRLQHLDEESDRNRRYRQEHHARILVQSAEYRAIHGDEIRARRRANPEANRDYVHRYRARRMAAKVGPIDWDIVYERDSGFCHICHKRLKRSEMTLDHAVPLIRGGAHSMENVRPAHKRCNSVKYCVGPGQPFLF